MNIAENRDPDKQKRAHLTTKMATQITEMTEQMAKWATAVAKLDGNHPAGTV